MIPVLSIHQPYASLITAGVKRWETRSWPCPARYVGQRIAIASTVQRETYGCHSCLVPSCRRVAANTWVCKRCGDEFHDDPSWPGDRPTGCILGTVVITDSVPINEAPGKWTGQARIDVHRPGGSLTLYREEFPPPRSWARRTISDQLPYGYWEPGGWAWELTDPQPTTERCPWCAGRGFRAGGPMLRGGPICPVCAGSGHCDPIPVKGRQGIWRWDGTRRPT